VIFDQWRYLLGLGLVPAALIVGWWALRGKEEALRFLTSRHRFHRPTVVAALLLESAGLGLLFCALAGPERTETAEELARRPLDVVVALDVSLSMGAEDVAPSRIVRARRALGALVDRLAARGESVLSDGPRNARLGLVEFSGAARVVSPLTSDFRVIGEILPSLDGREMDVTGSDLASGIEAALELFAAQSAARLAAQSAARDLIVITDGEHRGGLSTLEALIAAARGGRVSVSALIVGTPEGARIPLPGGTEYVTDSAGGSVLTRSRTDLVAPIVRASGGTLVTSQERSFPMDTLFEALAERAGTSAPAPADGGDRSLFQWFLLASLLCFLAGGLLNRWAAPGGAARVPLAAAVLLLCSCGAGDSLDCAREGDRFFRNGDLFAAAAAFEEALSLDPDNDGISLNLGLVAYSRGDYAGAARFFERALDSTDRRLSLPARFCLGLCHYRRTLGALEEGSAGAARAALEKALEAARAGAGIFESLVALRFRPADSKQNEEILLALADEIGKKMAALDATVDNGSREESSSGDGADRNAARGGAEETAGLTGRAAPRRPPEGAQRVDGWADDPGDLSPDEIRRIYARLDELKRGRQEREARRMAQRMTGEVDW